MARSMHLNLRSLFITKLGWLYQVYSESSCFVTSFGDTIDQESSYSLLIHHITLFMASFAVSGPQSSFRAGKEPNQSYNIYGIARTNRSSKSMNEQNNSSFTTCSIPKHVKSKRNAKPWTSKPSMDINWLPISSLASVSLPSTSTEV